MKHGILLLGSSGHAKVLADIIALSDEFYLAGIIDDFLKPGTKILGTEVIGTSDTFGEASARVECNRIVVAVGHNFHRVRLVQKIESRIKVNWQTLIHPAAVIAADTTIEAGTVVMAGAVINAGAHVGAHCIVNTNASIDHDCRVARGASIGPGACLGGHVTIGECAIVALGANVLNRVTLGEHALLGAGATAVNNIESYKLAVGTPAKVKRARTAEENYL